MNIFRAARGIVFVAGDDDGRLKPLALRPAGGRDLRLSSRLLDRLRDLKAPALIGDVDADPRTQGLESIAVGVGSIIASPIVHGDATLGLVYLESPERGRPFSPRDLAFLERFAAFASDVVGRAGEARRLTTLSRNLSALHHLEMRRGYDLDNLVGASAAMNEVRRQVGEVAAEEVTTLITGETGTGKDLIARAIHARSDRREAPFVAVNCMALPPELVESELFGHVKGAFSGATDDRVGRLEMASGGTLFLDEVGELAPPVQVKLLRVLQERVYERVGEGKPRKLDIRILCATNADLQALIRAGRFREDFYYRICVFHIQVPPLRERCEDVPLLVGHFLEHFNRRMRKNLRAVDPDALALLKGYAWPGNVRELCNVVEQAFVRARSDCITPDCLPSLQAASPRTTAKQGSKLLDAYPADLEAARRLFERELIQAYLEKNDGNVSATARELKTSRRNLYKKLKDE